MIFPVGGSSRALDGNSTFLFLFHPVHYRFPIVNFADAVAFSGVIENPFGSGGFPGVNMSHDADITHSLKH
jgi:hypothetical protein